jgi:hypothetical protein
LFSNTVIIPFTKKGALNGLKKPRLFGKIIQLSIEFKYLGLMLDRGLMLGAQLKEVMNTAYRPSGHVKALLGRHGD